MSKTEDKETFTIPPSVDEVRKLILAAGRAAIKSMEAARAHTEAVATLKDRFGKLMWEHMALVHGLDLTKSTYSADFAKGVITKTGDLSKDAQEAVRALAKAKSGDKPSVTVITPANAEEFVKALQQAHGKGGKPLSLQMGGDVVPDDAPEEVKAFVRELRSLAEKHGMDTSGMSVPGEKKDDDTTEAERLRKEKRLN